MARGRTHGLILGDDIRGRSRVVHGVCDVDEELVGGSAGLGVDLLATENDLCHQGCNQLQHREVPRR